MTTIAWFRRDLRVHDNPALSSAMSAGDPVACLFVVEPGWLKVCPARGAAFAHAVAGLAAELERRGAKLIVRAGPAAEAVPALARETGASRVLAAGDVTPAAVRRDKAVARALDETGISFRSTPGLLVRDPGAVRSSSGDPYKVFTPYHKAWLAVPPRDRWSAPSEIPGVSADSHEGALAALAAARTAHEPALAVAEREARRALRAFLGESLGGYDECRHRLDGTGGSMLSAALRTGALSSLECATEAAPHRGSERWIRQLAWRDFASQTAARWPALFRQDLRKRKGQWSRDAHAAEEWRTGTTGVATVDAAMRQLASQGWISNRARMMVGSFLVRDMNIHWREGARHFMRTLADGDPAVNAFNWQWVAGTGYDVPAPYWRLSPDRQQERHDPGAAWLMRWLGRA